MFFDNSKFFDFTRACKEEGITAPIIPGLKILKSVRQLTSIPKAFHIDFPDELVEEIMNNQDHVEEIGVNWAIKQTKELIAKGVSNVHFYVMNDAEKVIKVMESL